jgi:drug/metabolite transporter (DMT)-like permease
MISTLGLLLALGTAVSFAAFGILSRVLSVKNEDPLAFSAAYGCWGGIIGLVMFLFEAKDLSDIAANIIWFTFITTVLYAIFDGTQFYARKYLEASYSTLVYQIVPVVTFFVSIVFLDERFTWLKLGAVALIILGNLVALFKNDSKMVRKGLFYAIIGGIALGLAYVGDKVASSHYPLGLYILITYFVPAVYVFVVILAKRSNPITVMKRQFIFGSWKLPLLAVTSVTGYAMLLKAFTIADASVAIPVIFSSTMFTSLGGIFILKEKSNLWYKLAGAVLVTAGIILIH